jgi:hypothetical protein
MAPNPVSVDVVYGDVSGGIGVGFPFKGAS